MDAINDRYEGRLAAEAVDVDEYPELAKEYNVTYHSLDEVLEIFRDMGIDIE